MIDVANLVVIFAVALGDPGILLPPDQDLGEAVRVSSVSSTSKRKDRDGSDDTNVRKITVDVAETLATDVRSQNAEFYIDRKEGERTAGTQGDLVRGVQTMAGVARPAIGSTGIVVWGASSAQTRLMVDWIPVPKIFHAGGMRSIIPARQTSGVRLLPGGFDARYGRAIGGLLIVDTVMPRSLGVQESNKRRGIHASLDPIDVSGGGDVVFAGGHWLNLAARHSLLRQSLALAGARSSHQILVPVPDYWDYQGKSVVHVGRTSTLTMLVFGAGDRSSRGIPSLDVGRGFVEDTRSRFHRVGVSLRQVGGDGSTRTIAAWVGGSEDDQFSDYGDVELRTDESVISGGLRLDQHRDIASWISLRMGLDLEVQRNANGRTGALSLPPREGDIAVFGQHPGNRVNSDRWKTLFATAGMYVGAAIKFPQGHWILEPGLRVEPGLLDGDRVLPVRPTEPEVGHTRLIMRVDPRLRMTWTLDALLAFYAAVGRYHQMPASEDLSSVFGNPRLGPSASYPLLAGFSLVPAEWVRVDTTMFWVHQDRLSVRSPLASPAMAQLLGDRGRGRSYGVQVGGRVQFGPRLQSRVSYALTRAERRAPGEGRWRLFDEDQTHGFNMMTSWLHKSGIEIGSRLQINSGSPRTPVIGAVFDVASASYDPIFGKQNSRRLPNFLEISVRLAWRRQTEWGMMRTWIDVQNVTNRRNAEEVFYNASYTEQAFVEGLPILPTLGLEVVL